MVARQSRTVARQPGPARNRTLLFALLACSALGAEPAFAQGVPVPFKPGLTFRLGLGGGSGGTTVSDESNTTEGLIGTAGLGISWVGTRVLVEAEGQPFKVQNPARDEAFRGVYVLGAFQAGLLGLYVRPGAGIGALFFSGEDIAVDNEVGPAVGISAGYEIPLTGLAIEGIARWCFVEELDARLYGIQLVKSWRLF
jgi:hypothetical protein